MPTIKLKRGVKSNLPATGSPGEPHFITDSKEIYIAGNDNALYPVKTLSDNIIDKGTSDGVAALDTDTNVIHYLKTDKLYFHAVSEVTINYNQNILIESLPTSEFRVANWIINVADQLTGEFYTCQLSAHHNGIAPKFTVFGVIGDETVDFSVVVEDSFLRLYGLSSKNSQVVRVITTAIRFT